MMEPTTYERQVHRQEGPLTSGQNAASSSLAMSPCGSQPTGNNVGQVLNANFGVNQGESTIQFHLNEEAQQAELLTLLDERHIGTIYQSVYYNWAPAPPLPPVPILHQSHPSDCQVSPPNSTCFQSSGDFATVIQESLVSNWWTHCED